MRTQPFIRPAAAILLVAVWLTACDKDYDVIYLNKETPVQIVEISNEPLLSDDDQVLGQKAAALTLVGTAGPYKRGAKASLSVKGAAETEYVLQVFYSSGESKASGLGAKVSGGDGSVTWSWTVGAATKTGVYYAVVTGGGESLTVEFEVTD